MENLNLILLVIIVYLLYKDIKNSNTLENFNPDQFIKDNTDTSGTLKVDQDVKLEGNLYLNDDFTKALHKRLAENSEGSMEAVNELVTTVNTLSARVQSLENRFIQEKAKNMNNFAIIKNMASKITELENKTKFKKITCDQIDTNIVNITGDNNLEKAKKLGDGVLFRDKGQMVIGTDDHLYITNLTNGQNVHINNGNINCDNLSIKKRHGSIKFKGALKGDDVTSNMYLDHNNNLITTGTGGLMYNVGNTYQPYLKNADQVFIKSGRTGNHLQDNGSNNRYLKGHGTFSNQNRGGHETMTIIRK